MAWPESVVARDALHDKEFRGSHIRISFGNPAKANIATGPISPRFNPPAAHRGQPYARGGLYPPPSLPVRTPQGSAISQAQPPCLFAHSTAVGGRTLPSSIMGGAEGAGTFRRCEAGGTEVISASGRPPA
jgi:hypothetical protein